MLAVPLTFALNAPAREAGAQADQQSIAQVTQADFAKYAYAFNQGYEAKAVSSTTSSSASVGTCAVTPGVDGAQAEVTSAGAGAMAGSGAPAVQMAGYGRGSAGPAGKQSVAKPQQDRLAAMVNSYNSYTSMVYNSSSVTNTNSNNTVGSNNTSTNSVKVEDSKGVFIGMSSNQSAEQKNINDSFNKDSYNTTTETTIVNDSFNKETNVAIDSGNTTTNNTAVTKVEDSYNTENKTKVDVDITKSEETTTNNTTTNTENSHNDVNIEDNKVELES